MKFAQQLALVSILLFSVPGCSRYLPRVKPPKIDASAAAEGALAAFDTNQDGAISREESKQCAGIADNWDRYDANGDESISRPELETRFAEWSDGDTGLMNVRVEVIYRGQPLTDAHVQLTPYEFLGPNVLAADGTTDRYGYSFLAIPKDNLPSSQQGVHGMQVGLYRASITHPSVNLPAKYNQQTELSVDLSSAESNLGIRFALM